jgi:hypothetical protein
LWIDHDQRDYVESARSNVPVNENGSAAALSAVDRGNDWRRDSREQLGPALCDARRFSNELLAALHCVAKK